MYKTREQIEALKNRQPMSESQIQQTIKNLRCTEQERETIRKRVADGDGNLKGALYGSFLRFKRKGVIK